MNPPRPFLRPFIVLCAVFLLGGTVFGQEVRQSIAAHVPAAARLAKPLGTLPGEQRLSVAISLPLRNRSALTNLLHEVYNPASPSYHHYLSRAEFTKKFGPSEEDYNALKKFIVANGLRVSAEHANRMLLEVNGTAANLEKVFHTTLKVYRHPTEARTFYAPTTEPSLALGVPLLSVSGLDNFALARPHLKATPLTSIRGADSDGGSSPAGTYGGYDFRAAYVPDTARTGAGQIVGLVQFDGYSPDDVSYYETQTGLPSVSLTNILLNGAVGQPSGDGGEVEVSLDIEVAIAMAPGLSAILVYEAPNPSPFEVILNRMASDDIARQLSCSWYIPGGVANPATDQIFQEMALQGQTFFNASGDNDAYAGMADFPEDSSYVTQVGGSTLTTESPGGARVSETVWNRGNGVGSGGGVSTQYPIPSWQTNIDMSGNQGSTTMRNVPDVALTAENIYVRVDGLDYRVGGTSCAAPLWAGFAALANEEASTDGQPPIGFINPLLDKIGVSPDYNSCFFDITNGDNTSAASPTQYYAAPGYDLCTGWGTPAGQRLIDALANPEALHILPADGFISAGGVGGPFTVTSQELTLTNTGTNSLDWQLASTASWLDVSPTSGTLNSSNAQAFVTVNLNSNANDLPLGAYSAAVWFTNLTSKTAFERDYSLSVISPPTITTQPADESVLDGDTALFVVQAGGGTPLAYQWQLNGTNLTDGGNISGSSTANLTVAQVSPADLGAYSVIVTNAAGSAVSSNATLTITDSKPVITSQPTNVTLIAGKPATFSVTAIGSKPISYQWIYGGPGGTNIDDATNSTLVLNNARPEDAGSYSVIVSNALGAATSLPAVLKVFEVPIIAAMTPGCGPAGTNITISGWNFSSNAADNVVYFGPVQTPVLRATSTNLLVTVPSGATFSPVTVTVNGLTAFGRQPFLPVFPGLGQINHSSLDTRLDFGTQAGPQACFIADLDGDGKPDLIVPDTYSGVISIFQNTGTNTAVAYSSFTPTATLNVGANSGENPYTLALADLDGDGKIDIVALNSDSNIVSVFRNISSPGPITSDSFAPRIDLPGGNSMRGLAVQDLDGDGKPEIVTGNQGDGNISVFKNESTPGNIAFAARVNFPANSGAAAVAIGDIDGDGKPDIIVANVFSNTISIFRNLGLTAAINSNSFDSQVELPAPQNPTCLALGDVDGDGKLDLIVGGADGASEIAIYRNLASAGSITTDSFAPAVSFAAPGWVNSVALGDLDGDGKLDIACVCQNPDALSIFKNASVPGAFTSESLAPRLDFETGINPSGLFLGDLDGDGRPDIVFGDFYSGTFSIYRNIIPFGSGPAITTQPTNQLASVGCNATFTIAATGTDPLFYQWYFNGSNSIIVATNSSFTLSNIQLTQAGSYSVIVTNRFGSVLSSNVVLTVTPLHHLAWNTVPSPRFANAPFAVTITAQDVNNGTFTGFNGTVALNTLNGVPVSPPISGNFVNGVWTGAISVPQITSGLVLQADDGAGHTGLANSIDIIAPPSLGMLNLGNSMVITWPTGSDGFVLESAGDLTSGTWTPVNGASLLFNGQNSQSVPFSSTNQFFRLHFIGP